jgi:protein-S-isoprenylcysteine O-methyltransferase Ste14
MFTLMRAIAWSAKFIDFVLVFLPGQLLQWAGVTRPAQICASQIAGASLVLLGGVLGTWSLLTFALVGRGTPAPSDPPRRLVLSGPSLLVRNPMYLGAGLAQCGAALVYRSPTLAAYALLLLGVVNVFVHWYEEPPLRRLFGAEYEAHCHGVPRWWSIRSWVPKAGA